MTILHHCEHIRAFSEMTLEDWISVTEELFPGETKFPLSLDQIGHYALVVKGILYLSNEVVQVIKSTREKQSG